jgi:hypothetical protein
MPLIQCPDCGKDVSDMAPACIHCGRPLKGAVVAPEAGVPDPPKEFTETTKVPVVQGGHSAGWLGWLLVAGGAVGLIVALNMDTSVSTGGDYLGFGVSTPRMRVNNLGLMEERRNFLMLSGLACLIGVILIVTARPDASIPPAEPLGADQSPEPPVRRNPLDY